MTEGIIDLRLGDWREVLGEFDEVDAVISDPPFSPRTHEGRRTGSEIRQSGISYDALTRCGAQEIVDHWAPRIRRWVVLFGDHTTAAWYRADAGRAGLYVFQPIPWCKPDAAPRMSGDGPASAAEHLTAACKTTDAELAAEWITVARTRSKAGMLGSTPGFYVHGTASTRGSNGQKGFPGQKPLALMRALIRDYTKPGDLIIDPFAGSGTTLLAARAEGRNCVGAEIDPETYEKAKARLARPHTMELFG